MLSFIRILFPLRKAFKYTIPNDAFLLEHFNFWLGIISRAILAGSSYGRYKNLEGCSRQNPICDKYNSLLLVIMSIK